MQLFWQKLIALIVSFFMMLGINIPGFTPDSDNSQPEAPTNGVVITVATDESGKTTEKTTLENGTTIPAGVQIKDGVSELTLSIEELPESDANITLGEGETALSLDVHIEGISEDNNVAIIVDLGEILDIGLNYGNISLYHEENGVFNQMTQVSSMAELDAHNEFFYDVVTGNVTIAVATFSTFVFATDPIKAWTGIVADGFAGGSGTEADPYLIANADQLAYLGKAVVEGETFEGKYIKLLSDINMSGESIANKNNGKLMFYPIGYDSTGFVKAFSGTFDGAGHKISNIYQNTWMLEGNYDGNYYNAAMGLFGYVYGGTIKNLTINNFKSEGEFAPTGCVAAYAGNSTFENIAVVGSHPQTYNTSVAAVVGRIGHNGEWLNFKNITVDSTNTVSALWGSWDVGAAGILGYIGPDSKVTMENCHVAATIDVYNDVCGNYQYYWYRYCGMLIGTVDKTKPDGSLDLSNITATNCTVNFGDRHEYYYCEFEANSQASYTEDYQFSRVELEDLIYTDLNNNGKIDAGEVTGCKHNHTAKEDKIAVYLPFYQLFGGYGWGVDGVDLGEYDGIDVGVDVSYVKFQTNAISDLEAGKEYKLSELFSAIDDAKINDATVIISIIDRNVIDAENTVTVTYNADSTNWENSTVTFTGKDTIDITIQDYNFCTPTTISNVTIK